jgi:hypothetical protein
VAAHLVLGWGALALEEAAAETHTPPSAAEASFESERRAAHSHTTSRGYATGGGKGGGGWGGGVVVAALPDSDSDIEPLTWTAEVPGQVKAVKQ